MSTKDLCDNTCETRSLILDVLNSQNTDYNNVSLIFIIAGFLFFLSWIIYYHVTKNCKKFNPIVIIGIISSFLIFIGLAFLCYKTYSYYCLYEKIMFR